MFLMKEVEVVHKMISLIIFAMDFFLGGRKIVLIIGVKVLLVIILLKAPS